MEPANPNSLRLSKVFLEIMQVADIYEDENIRVDINEEEQLESSSLNSNSNNYSTSNSKEQESNRQVQAIKNSKWRV